MRNPGRKIVVIYQPELKGRIRHHLRTLRVGGDSRWPRITRRIFRYCRPQLQGIRGPKNLRGPRTFSGLPIATVKRTRTLQQKNFRGFALVSENWKYLPEMTDPDWHELVVGQAVWMWRSLEEA